VVAETTRAYADICNAGHQLDVLRRVIGVQEGDLRLTRVVVSRGRSPAFEADRRDGLVESSRARLPGLAARQRNAAFRLATLIGEPPAAMDPTWLQCRQPLALGHPLPAGSGQDLLKRRPDIRMAERKLAADTARIGVATAALYPDIRLGGAVGSTGAATDLLSPLTNRFAIGPQVSWTLNRSAVRAQINGAKAQTSADLANFDGVVLKALREVEIALDTYAADCERQHELERARDHAERVATQTRQLHDGGRIGALPALDAERGALVAEQAVADGAADLNADQITVFMSLGGGWNTPAASSNGA
jgi:outer membrane protein TolC